MRTKTIILYERDDVNEIMRRVNTAKFGDLTFDERFEQEVKNYRYIDPPLYLEREEVVDFADRFSDAFVGDIYTIVDMYTAEKS